jgi:hypothetical protein
LELETPDGALVIAQVSATVPVYEFVGDTVMVELPVLPAVALTVMLALLESVKPAVVLLGACQKFPQPARNGATASNNLAHLPIFIAAPRTQYSGYTRTRSPTLF